MATHFVGITFMPREQPRHPRMSCTKYLERRIICAWKVISTRARRRYRASVLPEDFVLLNARRRSVRYV